VGVPGVVSRLVRWSASFGHGSSLRDWVGTLRQRKLLWVLGIESLGVDKAVDLAVDGSGRPGER